MPQTVPEGDKIGLIAAVIARYQRQAPTHACQFVGDLNRAFVVTVPGGAGLSIAAVGEAVINYCDSIVSQCRDKLRCEDGLADTTSRGDHGMPGCSKDSFREFLRLGPRDDLLHRCNVRWCGEEPVLVGVQGGENISSAERVSSTAFARRTTGDQADEPKGGVAAASDHESAGLSGQSQALGQVIALTAAQLESSAKPCQIRPSELRIRFQLLDVPRIAHRFASGNLIQGFQEPWADRPVAQKHKLELVGQIQTRSLLERQEPFRETRDSVLHAAWRPGLVRLIGRVFQLRIADQSGIAEFF